MLKQVTLDGVRLHHKADENKLWINRKYTLFLNDTTNYMIDSLIESSHTTSKENVPNLVAKRMMKRYKVTREKVLQDFETIIGIINSFARDESPLNMVGMEVIDNKKLKAPNRMDLSLTYRCNNKCSHCYLPENNSTNELTTEQWKQVIDKLWEIGIPEIVLTGGECTLRKDVVELAGYGKKFICGIITNGTNIDKKLAKELKKVELDWIQITLESNKESIHDLMQGRDGAYSDTISGIMYCKEAGLNISINATLTKHNKDIEGLLNFAKFLGIKYVSTNAIIKAGRGTSAKEVMGLTEKQLKTILEKGIKKAKKLDINFNWFLPTCYKNLNPIELGFGQRCCSACSINMMIEPNGDAIPCQSWVHEKLGNILKDDWNSIWNHPTAKKLRNHNFNKIISWKESSQGMTQAALEKTKSECLGCEYFDLCFGACPLDIINGEVVNEQK